MNSDPNEGVEQQPQPTLCISNCGFFANVGSGGYCSKCFRELQASEQKQQASVEALASACASAAAAAPTAPEQRAAAALPAPAIAPEQPAAAPAQPAAAPAAAAAAAAPDSSGKPSTRCQQCRKKVGLTGFKCKCGLLFCGSHRYAEAHDCTFDYKASAREKLAAANPLVTGEKVARI